jgi:hypothetical protein
MDSGATEREILEIKPQDPTAEPISLPLEFLKVITCDFSTERELGRGAYGVVYKVCPFLFHSNFQLMATVTDNEWFTYML